MKVIFLNKAEQFELTHKSSNSLYIYAVIFFPFFQYLHNLNTKLAKK